MKMNSKHFKAVELLYQGESDNTICTTIGITKDTLDKWKGDKDFKEALCSVAAMQIGDLVPAAVSKLREIITNPKYKETTKMHAIKEILYYAKLSDRNDINNDIKVTVEYV